MECINKKDRFDYQSNYYLKRIVLLISLVSCLVTFILIYQNSAGIEADIFLGIFSILTVIFIFLELFYYTLFFLLSLFTLIISWRLAFFAGYSSVTYLYLIALICIFIQFALTVKNNIPSKTNKILVDPKSIYEWQLLFFRMYIGYDLAVHCTEKIFVAPLLRHKDVVGFTQLGIHHSLSFVLLAGFIEFIGAFSIGCGFLTRIGAICIFAYLMICSAIGHHFSAGFIWANPGGGWEYPAMWGIFILSFAYAGATNFSIDGVLKEKFNLPSWLLWLMGLKKAQNY